MIKKGSGYKPRAFSLLLRYFLLAMATAAAPPVFAQEALPETPPVLRDFRLDPAPSTPARPPRDEPLIVPRDEQPAPTRAAPILQPTGPATTPVQASPRPATVSPRTATRPAATPDRQAEVATSPSPRESVAVDSTVIPEGSVEPLDAAPVLPSVTDSEQVQDQPEPVTTDAPIPAFPYWWLLAALAGVAVIFVGVRHFLSGRKEDAVPQIDAAEIEPVAPIIPEAAPVPATNMPIAPKADTAPAMLELSFTPSTATISINNLIIKGALQISNLNNKDAMSDLNLRLIVISASEIQDEVIEAFHADPDHRFVEKLGDAKPGEQITMDVTLSVPLSEIHSYQLGTKSLFAPIVVANVIYGSGTQGTRYEARLACMIGREANPPTGKMGALRMDLGPRSFGTLGQRPLFG